MEVIFRACNEEHEPYVQNYQNGLLFNPELTFKAIRNSLYQFLMRLSASTEHDGPFVEAAEVAAASFNGLAETMADSDTALTFVGSAFESVRYFQVGDGALVIDGGSLRVAKYGLRVTLLY